MRSLSRSLLFPLAYGARRPRFPPALARPAILVPEYG
jgi:hypothetical protein